MSITSTISPFSSWATAITLSFGFRLPSFAAEPPGTISSTTV
jgi:hypothetical protein